MRVDSAAVALQLYWLLLSGFAALFMHVQVRLLVLCTRRAAVTAVPSGNSCSVTRTLLFLLLAGGHAVCRRVSSAVLASCVAMASRRPRHACRRRVVVSRLRCYRHATVFHVPAVDVTTQ